MANHLLELAQHFLSDFLCSVCGSPLVDFLVSAVVPVLFGPDPVILILVFTADCHPQYTSSGCSQLVSLMMVAQSVFFAWHTWWPEAWRHPLPVSQSKLLILEPWILSSDFPSTFHTDAVLLSSLFPSHTSLSSLASFDGSTSSHWPRGSCFTRLVLWMRGKIYFLPLQWCYWNALFQCLPSLLLV